ncbi:hypothetical protein DB44_DN00060 [Candidatus Protochlamydia amoebophila]|uniref:Uncharacterized protein n=1 Tax=Candidatus Protochlamydia amoebophila TaxID=362787 RepID=A0A0C1JLL0_9BACT|nr:hypothetical protein DB44_DN00060 [Candidatus Protochlamydia amoebophila]
MQFSTIFQHVDHLLLEAPKFLIKNEENKKTFSSFFNDTITKSMFRSSAQFITYDHRKSNQKY